MNLRKGNILKKRFLFSLSLGLSLPSVLFAEPGWYAGQAERVEPGQFVAQGQEPGFIPLGFSPSLAVAVDEDEVVELARGLQHDPVRIFNYVHDHIAYTPYHGLLKGPQQTLLERSGNDFDQAALLFRLLELSGFEPVYGYGKMSLPRSHPQGYDLASWLKTGTSTSVIWAVLANGGIPFDYDETSFDVNRVWVEVEVDGTLRKLDPAYKRHDNGAGLDIAAMTGYSRAALLEAAGGTGDAKEIQNLNQSALFAHLDGLATNLLAVLRADHPNASMKDVLGDDSIIPEPVEELPTALRFAVSDAGTWTEIPQAYYHTVFITHDALDVALKTSDIAGRRLSITYAPANQTTPMATTPQEEEVEGTAPVIATPEWLDTNSIPAVALEPSIGAVRELALSDDGVVPMATDAWDFGRISTASPNSQLLFSCHPYSGSVDYSITLENPGGGAYTGTAYSFVQGGGVVYGVTTGRLFTLQLTAAGQTRGTKTAVARVSYKQSTSSVWKSVTYSMTGAVAYAPNLILSSGYNSVSAYTTDPVKGSTFVLRNDGPSSHSVVIKKMLSRVNGTPERFALTAGTGSGTIPAGGPRSVSWTFDPSVHGSFTTDVVCNFLYDGVPYTDYLVTRLHGYSHYKPDFSGSYGVNFGRCYLQAQPERDCVLKSGGPYVTTITSVSLTGENAAHFELVSGTGYGGLANGAQRNIKVRYKTDAIGSHSARVRVDFAYDGLANYIDFPVLGTTAHADLATLWLDDEPLATETGIIAGRQATLTLSIDHPYESGNGTFADQAVTYPLKRDGTYAIVHGFGGAETGFPLDRRRRKMESYIEQGLDMDSREMRVESLNLVGQGWMEQTAMQTALLNRLAKFWKVVHHRFGLAAQEEGCYVDVKAQCSAGGVVSGDTSESSAAAFKAGGMFRSSMEHAIIEQTMGEGSVAASTIKLLALANAQGVKIHLADASNFNALMPLLSATYSASDLLALNELINGGGFAILPHNGSLTLGQWNGRGYIGYKENDDFSLLIHMAISGDYGIQHGGYNGYHNDWNVYDFFDADWYMPNSVSINLFDEMANVAPASKDPVNLATGAFFYDNLDLRLGSGATRGLALNRHYTSASHNTDGAFGFGWTHSYDIRATEYTDYKAAFGRRTPRDAAPMLVASTILLDLLGDTGGDADAKRWMCAALAAHWATEYVTRNAVSVSMGDQALAYVKLPGGGYEPPPGVTTRLEKQAGTYRLIERFGAEHTFNAHGQLASITDVDGCALLLDYNAQNSLATVTDHYGRTLAFGYNADNRVTSVTDSTGRAVSYTYGPSGNLATFTDPEGYAWQYAYDPGHRLLSITDPVSTVTVVNTYDTLGRVMRQRDPGSNIWDFCYANFETRELAPDGGVSVYYFDARLRETGREQIQGHRTHVLRDGQDHVIHATDPNGNAAFFDFDASHNLTNRLDTLGHAWQCQYDSAHRLVAATDPLGNTTTYAYDAAHRPVLVTDPLGNAATMTYYSDGIHRGLLHTSTDALGGTTTHTYDPFGNLATVTHPDGAIVTNIWNARGDLLQTTDPLGNTTAYTHDRRRLPLTVTDPLGSVFTTGYNAAGRAIQSTDPLGRVTATVWTPSYNVASIHYPDGSSVTNHYDVCDRLTAVSDTRGGLSESVYDTAGRLIAATLPGGGTTSFARDPNGNVTSQTNALGHAARFQHDPLNRVVSQADPLDNTTATSYDPAGRVASVTNPLGKTRQWDYDPLGRTAAAIRPSGAADRFAYDARGNATAHVNAEGNPYAMAYDAMGRMTSATNALGVTVFTATHDLAGNLLTRTDANGNTLAHTYDPLHRLTATAVSTNGQPADGLDARFAYDPAGNLLAASNAAARLAFTYDAMNRLATATTTLAGGNAYTSAHARDPGGLVTNLTYAAGKSVAYAYDADARLTAVTDWLGNTWTFTYDAEGRPAAITPPSSSIPRATSFTHDPAGRLASWSVDGVTARAISHDAANRRTADTVTLGAVPAPTLRRTAQNSFDAAGRITSASVRYGQGAAATPHITEAFAHDPNGALTNWVSGTNALSISYNPLGQVTSLDARYAGVDCNATHAYDALGNRLKSGSSLFIPNHADPLKRPLMECADDGTVRRHYIWSANRLLGFIENDTLTVAHSDDFGSVVALTDATGAVLHTAHYGPHGEDWGAAGANPTPFAWLGGHGVQTLNDATPLRLHLTRHRLYSATLNRFLSPDPLGLTGGLNLYMYGEGNPLAYIDPLGLCAQSQSLGFGFGDYLYDVNQMLLGYDDAILGALQGLAGAVMNPHQATWSMMDGLANPDAVIRDTWNAVSEAWNSGYRGQGQVVLGALGTAAAIAAPYAKTAPATTSSTITTPYKGQTVYRVYGGDSVATGASWTPVNPSNASNFRNVAGLPSGGQSGVYNTGRFVMEGKLINPSAVQTIRPALPLDGNIGGIPEYIIPNWNTSGAIQLKNVSGVNPSF